MDGTGSGANATTSPAITKRRRSKRECMLGDIGWTILCVGRINVGSGFLRTFPLPQHARDILGNVHANGTAESMIIKCEAAFGIYLRNVAGVIGGVTNISASTVTRNVFHHIRV